MLSGNGKNLSVLINDVSTELIKLAFMLKRQNLLNESKLCFALNRKLFKGTCCRRL